MSDYPAGVSGPSFPDRDRVRPLSRDIEWNRMIKDMPVHEYCDWVLAGRPGYSDMSPHKIRAWQEGENGMSCIRINREKAYKLISAGMSNLDIADALDCKPNTIPGLKKELGFAVAARAHAGVPKANTGAMKRRPGPRASYAPGDLKKAAAAQDDAFSSRLGSAMQAQASAKAGRSAPAPKGKRLTNGGGIRVAMLSRADDAARPMPRTKEFLFGAKVSVQSGKTDNREAVPPVASESAMRLDSEQTRVPWNGQPVTLMDVGPRGCRWIVGNEGQGAATLCCGAHASRGSWCAEHRKRAWIRRVAPSEASGLDLSAPRARVG